jgi:hypothetical protein
LEKATLRKFCHPIESFCVNSSSLLSSIAVDHLSKQTSSDVLAIHFFCDFSAQNEHTTVNILRSLVRQIIERGGENILGKLKALVDQTNTPQNAADITKMIATAGLSQPIYLVLDAVDEMKDSTTLLNCCLDLAQSGIQVLVTSRKLPHIEKKMSAASQLEISGSADDMKLYIRKRLQESDFEDEIAQDDAIIERMVSKSGGLYVQAITP